MSNIFQLIETQRLQAQALEALASTIRNSTSIVFQGITVVGTINGSTILASNLRSISTTNATYYVATTGSDSTGNGSSTAPWATYQHAYSRIADTTDGGGFAVTIQGDGGTYSHGINATTSLVGWSSMVVDGGSGTINTGDVRCFEIAAGAGGNFTVQNFTFVCSGSGGNALGIGEGCGGTILFFANITFGVTNRAHINAQSGVIFPLTNYTVSGGAKFHLHAYNGGTINNLSGVNATVTGTPNFSQYFAYSESGNIDWSAGGSFSGSATGNRYLAYAGGVIKTFGQPNLFPGNKDGFSWEGGTYS